MAWKVYYNPLFSTSCDDELEGQSSVWTEADIRCSRAVGLMEERLRNAYNASAATLESVIKGLDEMVAAYEVQEDFAPGEYQKLVQFLQRSLAGPIHNLMKPASDNSAAKADSTHAEDDQKTYQKVQIDNLRQDQYNHDIALETQAQDFLDTPPRFNYRKLTKRELKREMTEAGFGAEILAIRKPSKKALLDLYAKVMPPQKIL